VVSSALAFQWLTLLTTFLANWRIAEISIQALVLDAHRTKHFGTVNSDTNLLVQYEVDPTALGCSTEIFFQFQIKYTRVEDCKTLIRSITLTPQVTTQSDTAYRTADIEVIGLNAIRAMAHTAQLGFYTEARLENYAYLQLMKNVAKALSSSLTTTTLTTCSTTTATTKTQSKSSAEEVQDVLKSFTEHSRKFENTMYIEHYKEVVKGGKWDDTEEKMKVLEKQQPHLFAPNEKSEEGWLANTFSSFVNWVSSSSTSNSSTSNSSTSNSSTSNSSNNLIVTPSASTASSSANNNNQQVRVANRQDEVSNFLWNMRGANML